MLVLLNDAGCPVARQVRPWDRLLVRVLASRLDHDLARGASPDATVPLALRAQLLVGARTRRDLARGAQRILAAAAREPATGRPDGRAGGPSSPSAPPSSRGCGDGPAITGLLPHPRGRLPAPADGGLRTPAASRLGVPVCRDRVRDSAEELGDLIQCLLSGGPVAARGVALASVLLRDGSGPVYHKASADDVRARIREAVHALDLTKRVRPEDQNGAW